MDLLNAEYLSFFSCAEKNKLRYLMIGGYAVNYYGYNRNTHDLDIWLAPTNENRDNFIKTLICMGYSKGEVSSLYDDDFTKHFVSSVGSNLALLEFLTYVHEKISFDEAEKDLIIHKIDEDIIVKLVPYNFLMDMKLFSRRDKDLIDIAQLDKLNKKL